MDRKPGHLTKSVQEIAGSLFWIKVKLYNIYIILPIVCSISLISQASCVLKTVTTHSSSHVLRDSSY